MTQLPPVAAETDEPGDDETLIVEVVEVQIETISAEQEPERVGFTGPAGGQAGTPG
jgi:hypothetical protein